MKIKEFSNKFNLSYDTIRYYMKLNLINPHKSGGHYEFDQEDQNDIREILKLKEMGLEFLNEYKSQIKKIDTSMGKYEEFAQIGDQIFSYQVHTKK